MTRQLSEAELEGRKRGGAKTGNLTSELKIGIHSPDYRLNRRKIDSGKGGKIGGVISYNNKTGIHGLTKEKRKENITKALRTQGKTPWSEEEVKMAYDLSQENYFRRGRLVKNIRIAQALNGYYHSGNEVRTAIGVERKLIEYRRSLESVV